MRERIESARGGLLRDQIENARGDLDPFELNGVAGSVPRSAP
jgi:hypothetical protein